MPGDWREKGYDSRLAVAVQAVWLDLSIPDGKLSAKYVADIVGCTESAVRSIMCAHSLNDARKAAIRREAETKAKRLSQTMQDTVTTAVGVYGTAIDEMAAISKDLAALRAIEVKSEDEGAIILARMKICAFAAKSQKICADAAKDVQTLATKLAELRNGASVGLPAPSPEKPVNGQAIEGDALGFDEQDDEY